MEREKKIITLETKVTYKEKDIIDTDANYLFYVFFFLTF